MEIIIFIIILIISSVAKSAGNKKKEQNKNENAVPPAQKSYAQKMQELNEIFSSFSQDISKEPESNPPAFNAEGSSYESAPKAEPAFAKEFSQPKVHEVPFSPPVSVKPTHKEDCDLKAGEHDKAAAFAAEIKAASKPRKPMIAFANMDDMKKAVIYSEILTPKFKQRYK